MKQNKNKKNIELNIKENKKTFKKMWILMVIFVSVMFTEYLITGINDTLAINRKEENTVSIEIPNKSSVNDIANILCSNGVIKHANFFTMYSVITKSAGKFIPGNFEVKTNLDYEAVINYIQISNNRLEKDLVTVTIPEGLNVMECAELLEKNDICDSNKFLELCKSDIFDSNYSFLSEIKNSNDRYYKLEGYLFPDTYKFYKYENPKDSIKRMLNNYEIKALKKNKIEGYESKVSLEDRAKASNMTLDELTILASLIQAEAADEKDMLNVSSVLCNRLGTLGNDGVSPYGDGGMNLLALDSTVWYPYKTKEQAPNNILNKFNSTYDTYNIKGLPPGPICNPGSDAIEAALNPNKTNYYFFCHSKDRKAYYAQTLSDHNLNLKKAGLA